jgi:hypothetical protein
VIAVLRPAALSHASIFHAGIVKQGWKHAQYGTRLFMTRYGAACGRALLKG